MCRPAFAGKTSLMGRLVRTGTPAEVAQSQSARISFSWPAATLSAAEAPTSLAPSSGGVEACPIRGRMVPGCATLIVTSHGRPGHLKRALAAGVSGFLPKTVSAQVLADVVRTVHNGGRYVDPQLAAEAISNGISPLTARESDVLELAAGGATIDEIAKHAALAPGTVRNYLSSAVTK
ncbi:LuxR C-terminal-related transcriptional regulator [Nakamurella sp. GG22]